MSFIEFFGTLAGVIAVWLEARAHVWCWPVGLINIVLFTLLFFQVQLYPDMFLYMFFFITNLVGWWRWTHPRPGEEDRKLELKISTMPLVRRLMIIAVCAVGTVLFGAFASHLHALLPGLFQLPSAYPYLDSFVAVSSVVTTFLVIQKKIESWILWILIDAVATVLYFTKGIKFVALEYFVFCGLAVYGLITWTAELKSYRTSRHD